MKHGIRIAALCLVILTIALLSARYVLFPPARRQWNTVDLRFMRWEIADTDELRKQGLSDRLTLDLDAGMRFVFPERGIYPFWMKDMHFPLDIIWLDGDRVVDLVTLPPPVSMPATHVPLKRADTVLEVRAGRAKELGIGVGTTILLP